jgi:hypothetical protein
MIRRNVFLAIFVAQLAFGAAVWPQASSSGGGIAPLSSSRTVMGLQLTGTATDYSRNSAGAQSPLEITVDILGQSSIKYIQNGMPYEEDRHLSASRPACSTTTGTTTIATPPHNCFLPVFWALPQIDLQPGSSAAQLFAVEQEDPSRTRLHSSADFGDSATTKLAFAWSKADIVHDPASGQITELVYTMHPPKNAMAAIPARVEYSQYSMDSGVYMPHLIKRFVANQLVLQLTISSVSVE